MMTNEFLAQLARALNKKKIADADEIVDEYAQHFACKLADGYSEEEIAAKLGNPAELAEQFAQDGAPAAGGKNAAAMIGFGVLDVLAALLFAVLAAFGAALTAAALAFAVAGVCLLGNCSPFGFIPAMPRLSQLLFGLLALALAVLFGAGCAYYAAFLRQAARSFARFQHNALAGQAALPPLPLRPQMSARRNRRLRGIFWAALTAVAVLFVLGITAACIQARAFEFWHAWGWFGYSSGIAG